MNRTKQNKNLYKMIRTDDLKSHFKMNHNKKKFRIFYNYVLMKNFRTL